MIAKIHNHNGKMIIALCDSDLLGKKFEENDFILDLNSPFFKGRKATEQEIKPYLKKAYSINAVGKKSTDLLIENKLAERKNIKYVENIPHVHSVNMGI